MIISIISYVLFEGFDSLKGSYFAEEKIFKRVSFFQVQDVYLRTYKNAKERVNALNFAVELESVYFDRPCQNVAFYV